MTEKFNGYMPRDAQPLCDFTVHRRRGKKIYSNSIIYSVLGCNCGGFVAYAAHTICIQPDLITFAFASKSIANWLKIQCKRHHGATREKKQSLQTCSHQKKKKKKKLSKNAMEKCGNRNDVLQRKDELFIAQEPISEWITAIESRWVWVLDANSPQNTHTLKESIIWFNLRNNKSDDSKSISIATVGFRPFQLADGRSLSFLIILILPFAMALNARCGTVKRVIVYRQPQHFLNRFQNNENQILNTVCVCSVHSTHIHLNHVKEREKKAKSEMIYTLRWWCFEMENDLEREYFMYTSIPYVYSTSLDVLEMLNTICIEIYALHIECSRFASLQSFISFAIQWR